MVGFGFASSSNTTNDSGFNVASTSKRIPPPLASSTPKKRLNGVVHGQGRDSPTGNKQKPRLSSGATNGIHSLENGSPTKKRKVVYFDEDEDHGASLQINGHVTTVNGKAETSEKAKAREIRKQAALQEQRKELPIAKGAPINF